MVQFVPPLSCDGIVEWPFGSHLVRTSDTHRTDNFLGSGCDSSDDAAETGEQEGNADPVGEIPKENIAQPSG
jgi:hypothetical protein